MGEGQGRDRISQTGVEVALDALRGSLREYKETVNQGLKDIKEDQKEHARKQDDWQEKIETELLRYTGIPDRMNKVETKVGEHENAFQQLKGAAIAGRAVWVLIGLGVGAVAWLMSHVITIEHTAPAVAEPKQPQHVYDPSAHSRVEPASVPASATAPALSSSSGARGSTH